MKKTSPEERLEAAEAVCLLYGWSGTTEFDGTDRQLATLQLWNQWSDLVGMKFINRKAHLPEFSDAQIKQLADKHRDIRAEMLKKFEELVVSE
jgi:hypothetical protein